MLDITNLFVNFRHQFVFRSSRVIKSRDSQQLCPELLFLIFFKPELLVDFFGNLLWPCIFIYLDAISSFLDSVGILDDSVCSSGSFVEQECPLDLVLALSVPGWSGLVGHVPAVIVNITGVTAGVSGLRVAIGKICIFKSVSNHEVLVRILEVFVKISSHVLWVVRGWERNRCVPLASLRSQKVSVNFILNHLFNDLNFGVHVSLSIKESMLW